MGINPRNVQKKAALIEICGSHDECLYAQALFLEKSDFEVHIIISSDLNERFGLYENIHAILSLDFSKNRFKNFISLLKIIKYINKNNIENVIINTASGELIEYLTLLLPKRIKVFGVIHSLKKLTASFSQKIINRRIKKYFLLNDYLLPFVPKVVLHDTKFESFYPIYFPYKTEIIKKPKDEFWIVIPGYVEYKRRDYLGFLDLLKDKKLDKSIKFLIMGNSSHIYSDGKNLENLVSEIGYKDNFIFYYKFLQPEIFLNYIAVSDLILPLMHPGIDFYPDYINNQISGTINLAFSFKKPMLLFKDFNMMDDFKASSFFYDLPEMHGLIELLFANKDIIDKKSIEIKNYKKFDFEFQRKKYVNFFKI
jgi:hypothetical protein